MNNEEQVRAIISMLKATASTAQHASLTGSLQKGRAVAIKNYNGALRRLKALGVVDDGIFEELDESADIDEVGFAAEQLAGYAKGSTTRFSSESCCGDMFDGEEMKKFIFGMFGGRENKDDK
jgi:hypothetical protein